MKDLIQKVPLFSIVLVVHNAEASLAGVLKELFKQKINFQKYVQLILVDDASTDRTGELCDKYAAKYPKNIIVIHQQSQAIATARNVGIAAATGEYLNILDVEDRLSLNTLSLVKDYFEHYSNEVDIVVIPTYFYDVVTNEEVQHPIINRKFARDKFIFDLTQDANVTHSILASAFIKREAIEGFQFGQSLSFVEELCLISLVSLKKMALGGLPTASCRCSSKKIEANVINEENENPKLYETPSYLQNTLVNYAQSHFLKLPRVIKCVVAYYIQWILRYIPFISVEIGLSESCVETFNQTMEKLFAIADDRVILTSNAIWREHQISFFHWKYNRKLVLINQDGESRLSFEKLPGVVFKYPFLQWHAMYVRNGNICLCISCVQFQGMSKDIDVFAKVHKQLFKARYLVTVEGGSSLGRPLYYRHLYEIEFAEQLLPQTARVKFYFTYNGKKCFVPKMSRHFRFPISENFHAAYCILGNRCVLVQKDQLVLTKEFRHWRKEVKFLLEVLKKREKTWLADIVVRIIYFIYQKLNHKPIWLLKDRSTTGGDNAEALFIHLREKHPEVRAYFIVDKKSPDWKRLKKYGNMINYGSIKQRIYNALAAVCLSSQVEVWFKPGERGNHAMRSIIALRPFIFLQHGITHNGNYGLGKHNNNFAGFVTAAMPERDSIVNEPYGYSAQEVWLTGFPRFDRLYHDEKKQITIMPTWRKWLFSSINLTTGVWSPLPNFIDSHYFKFYNDLLNHPRLIDTCEQCGYRIAFYPHPMIRLSGLIDNFSFRFADVLPSTIPYRDIYAQSDLVVTDYTSAVFDFAYLRKPIVYTQFDKEEFYSGKHSFGKGYFDYERDGFGEVTYTLEETVDCLIDYMKHGCQLKDKYRERIDHFFAFNDRNNCERVYEKVVEFLATQSNACNEKNNRLDR